MKVIWVDYNVNSQENQVYLQEFKGTFPPENIEIVTTIEDAIPLIQKTIKVLLIVSGSLG